MEMLQSLWPVLQGLIVMPLTAWLKKLVPGDVPIATTSISAVLNLGLAFGINALFTLGLANDAIVTFALIGHVTAQVIHAGTKTKAKNDGRRVRTDPTIET